MFKNRITLAAIILITSGCSDPAKDSNVITLATTTSTRDSGLLDELLPLFEKQTGIRVKVVAVGSGQALEIGRRGDADVLITHAPQAEQQFISNGFGIDLQLVMHNDFVLVGPDSISNGIRYSSSIVESFQMIADKQLPFVSRGDESGTNLKEQQVWLAADRSPFGDWYIRGGTGMAQALRMSNELRAYTLADRGTFLAHRKGLELAIVCEGDSMLLNPYSVILVNPSRHPGINHWGASRFAEFLNSPETQRLIENFGVSKYGRPLFVPKSNGSANQR